MPSWPDDPATDTEKAEAKALCLRVSKRLQREGRWFDNVAEVRDEMMADARKQGLAHTAAQNWCYAELDRLYPPQSPTIAPEDPKPPPDTRVKGLHDIPPGWPTMPETASLQADLAWVQSNRLAVTDDRPDGTTAVQLSRARSPAPSLSALGWLETSIRSYAKYIDIVGRTLATAQDEQENVRRERMAIDEIRALLREMREP